MAIKFKTILPNLHKPQFRKFYELVQNLITAGKLDSAGSYRIYITDGNPIKLRSNQQNKYLWGVVYKAVSEGTGYTPEEVHRFFKVEFALRTTFSFWGSVVEEPKSTASFTRDEMREYIDKIRMWGDTNGIHIPDANSLDEELYISMEAANLV